MQNQIILEFNENIKNYEDLLEKCRKQVNSEKYRSDIEIKAMKNCNLQLD